MKKGDIILVDGTPLYGSVIRTLTGSEWGHTAVAVNNQRLIEADENGVVLIDKKNFFPRYKHYVILRPIKSIVDVDKFINDCLSFKGVKYGWYQILIDLFYLADRKLVGRDTRKNVDSSDPAGVICSEYPAKAFLRQGLWVREGVEPQLIRPDDYMNCKFLQFYKKDVDW